jgi:hypothetical protein
MATIPPTPRTNKFTVPSLTAGPFNVGFRLFENSALTVYLDGVKSTAFSVTATYANGYSDAATITFSTAVASGVEVLIDGTMTPRRQYNYLNGDPQLVAKMNIELGRLWASVSEIAMQVGRSLRGLESNDPLPEIDWAKVLAAGDNAIAAQEAADDAAQSAADAAATVTAQIGEATHDRILATILRHAKDQFQNTEVMGLRRSFQLLQDPYSGDELSDDTDEPYPATLNSTAGGKALQYLARVALTYPSRTAALMPFVEEFADTLISLQWDVHGRAIDGGFALASSSSTASTFGTATAGLGLLYAYRLTGAQRYLIAAIKAANFVMMMNDPNPVYLELYGETPIPNRTVGGVTFDGFCDLVQSDDVINITSTTWNIVACKFLHEMFVTTETPEYQTVADAALEFYSHGALQFYDLFAIENNSPTAHVGIRWNLSTRLDLADHKWHSLGELTTSNTPGAFATTGTVAAVAGTSVTLAASASAADGAYVGMVLDTLTGTGELQGRKITAYNGTTKVATIEKVFLDAIDTSTTYRIGHGVNSVGTDQVEYGMGTLHAMGWPEAELTAAYEEIMSWPTTSTGSFGAAFNPRICLAGYLRVNSGIYGGDGRHFGSYYDGQGGGAWLAMKFSIAPADYLLALDLVRVIPDRAALLDENFNTIFGVTSGRATKGIIPLALAGSALLDVFEMMEA